MIRIITDSAADFEPEELKRLNVECVPLTVTLGNASYKENINISKDSFFNLLELNETASTSQPNVDEFKRVFESSENKDDEIISILISSKLSGASQSAFMAASFNRQGKCYIFDSCTATAGQRILVEYAVKMRDEGKPAGEIMRRLAIVKPKLKIFACLDTLKYLHRGGRINGTAAAIGSITHIKPIITLTEDGRVNVPAKAFGRHGGVVQMLRRLEIDKPDLNYPIYVMYSHNRKLGEELADKLRASGYNIDDSRIVNIGAAIGTHIGPNAYGTAYVSK